jgi:hypothetical protein
MKSFKEFMTESPKFKLGDKAKVNKPGHALHDKVITIVKGATGDRTKRDIYAGGVDDSLASSNFSGSELKKVVSEARGLEGLKRKLVPGYGKNVAKKRETREYGKAQKADYAGDHQTVDRKERTADRFARVSQGKKPFSN